MAETAKAFVKLEKMATKKARMAEHARSCQAVARSEKTRASNGDKAIAALKKEKLELEQANKRKDREHKKEMEAARKTHAAATKTYAEQLMHAQLQSTVS